MKILLPALLVGLSVSASVLALTSDRPDVAASRQGDPWLWSTGDFTPDRGWTVDDVPPDTRAGDAA